MRAVMLSIRQEWCRKIMCGCKTMEIRKNRPKIDNPFKVYIYCSGKENLALVKNRFCKGGKPYFCTFKNIKSVPDDAKIFTGKVIGEFTCDYTRWIPGAELDEGFGICDELDQSCLTLQQMRDYSGWKESLHSLEKKLLYGWHISNLVIYDHPKEISDFTKEIDPWDENRVQHPPQSWFYVEELRDG